MKYFKFKDLVINVLPEQDPAKPADAQLNIQACAFQSCACVTRSPVVSCGPVPSCGLTPCAHCASRVCTYIPSCVCASGICSYNPTCVCASNPPTCPCVSRICSAYTPIYSPMCQTFDPGDPIDLVTLKEQLKQAVAQLEEQERAAEEALKPQTVAEVEQFEQKLNDALGELKNIKEDLRKRKA